MHTAWLMLGVKSQLWQDESQTPLRGAVISDDQGR